VSRQPDFSTAPRRRRVPAWETLAVGAGLVALALAAGEAWQAREEARSARSRLATVRREVDAASARLRDLESRARGPARALPAAESPPARIVADLASAIPGDVRLERLVIDYARDGALEIHVVARDAGSWDRLLARLEEAPWMRDVRPGPEEREAQVRSVVQGRWVGGRP
jgi:Tfp pilus assembly protein PilN